MFTLLKLGGNIFRIVCLFLCLQRSPEARGQSIHEQKLYGFVHRETVSINKDAREHK